MITDASRRAGEQETIFSFAEMRLRVGERIQLQLPAALGTERYIVKLIGYLDRASVLVTAPSQNGVRPPLRENDKVVARIFSSQKAFAFDSLVNRINNLPYPYLHLSFPETVQGSVIRKSARIRTQIAATAALKSSGQNKSVQITNLSVEGALVRAPQPIDQKNQEITMTFLVKLHHIETQLSINAVIRSITDEGDKTPDPAGNFSHGMQFTGVSPNDAMIIQSLVYQQMIEHPQTVI